MYNHEFTASYAHSSNTTQKKDGGIVLNGGNIASARNTAKGMETLGFRKEGGDGSRIVDTADLDKALTAGTLAKMTAGAYVMRRVTTTLAGVANTTLLTGASDFGRRSIHKTQTVYVTKLSAYNFFTGAATYADSNYTPTDDAATPTRAIPGEFTITPHGNTTDVSNMNKDYPAKTG